MTVELHFRFPLGRVHATPWGENPNEGSVEWPPSPWRLLRALYGTWRSRVPELDAEAVIGLLDQLADPPTYFLPRHALAHTRHYFPGPAHQQGVKTDKSKVLDAFVSVSPNDELIVRWDVELDSVRQLALKELAGHLTYLGRAESICDVTATFEATPDLPHEVGRIADEDSAPSITLLSPNRPLDESMLTVTSTQVRSVLKRREPPQTSRLRYAQPAPGPDAPARNDSQYPAVYVDTMRWSIASTARPSKFAAVGWADTLRQAVFSKYGGPEKRLAPASLSGKGPDGSRSDMHHNHVHWFAFGAPGDRLLSTLVAWAPGGFVAEGDDRAVDEEVLDAMANVRFLRSKGIRDVHSCSIGVEGWGRAQDIVPELASPSSLWRSYTPFAPSRHQHKNAGSVKEFYETSIGQELVWRRYAGLEPRVEVLNHEDWHHFRRHRPSKERLSQARQVVGLTLEFSDPFAGPLALGALSHFGLGLFVPMDR